MSTMKIRDIVPDVEYRVLMLKLSRLLSSSEDIYELTYMLKFQIPAGKRERFNTPLELFEFLENLEYLGPTKLYWLHELFQKMEKPDLSAMILNFITKCGEDMI